MAILERGKFITKEEQAARELIKDLHHGRYADDTAANTGGVPVGGSYWNTTYNKLHTRMS